MLIYLVWGEELQTGLFYIAWVEEPSTNSALFSPSFPCFLCQVTNSSRCFQSSRWSLLFSRLLQKPFSHPLPSSRVLKPRFFCSHQSAMMALKGVLLAKCWWSDSFEGRALNSFLKPFRGFVFIQHLFLRDSPVTSDLLPKCFPLWSLKVSHWAKVVYWYNKVSIIKYTHFLTCTHIWTSPC